MIKVLAIVSLLLVPQLALAQTASTPLLRMELDKSAVIPGQPMLLRVSLLTPTWFLQPPIFPSFEVANLMVRLPEGASGPINARVGDETWSGVGRTYRLYPMTVGRFRIPPRPIELTYADPQTRKPTKATVQTREITVTGVAPANAAELKPFIAAQSLRLKQTIDGKPDDMQAGDALTRAVAAKVVGVSPLAIPPMIPSLSVEGLAAYAREPMVREAEATDQLSGQRTESVTYIAEAGGRFRLPAIRLRWYNLSTQTVETAEVPGFGVAVRGPPPPATTTNDWRELAFWAGLSAMIITLAGFALCRLWPAIVGWRDRRRARTLASEAHAFEQARSALDQRRFADAVRAISLWSARLPSIESAEDAAFEGTMTKLGAAIYGNADRSPAEADWVAAAQALTRARQARLKRHRASSRGGLPPLNPTGEVGEPSMARSDRLQWRQTVVGSPIGISNGQRKLITRHQQR